MLRLLRCNEAMTTTPIQSDVGSPRAARRGERRGVVYVAVMGVALIIAVLTMGALHIVQIELRATGGLERMTAANNAANAAVEFAIAAIRADANWRNTYASGQESPQNSWTIWDDRSKFKFALVDDDGNLADDDRDPVTVRGIGAAGDAVAAISVILEPSGAALSCLESALHSQDDVDIAGGVTTGDQFVSSNDDVKVYSGCTLESDVWAADDVLVASFATHTGNAFENAASRDMPDAAHLYKYYLANGTWIDLNSIPGRTISQANISAASNPYGAKNPQGIYVIDCGNQQLTISDSRIKATIVVLSTATTVIEGSMNWEPPAPNMPSLLVTGNLNMRWNGGTTVTGALLGLLGGGSDLPGLVKGLIYVGGNLTITNTCVLQGPVVVGGAVMISSNTSITYDGSPYNYPPPGFSKGAVMRVVPGAWQRTTRN